MPKACANQALITNTNKKDNTVSVWVWWVVGAGNENESCKSGTADSLGSLSSAATTATLTATGSLGLETAGMRWQRRRQRNVQRHRKLHNTNFAHAPKIYEFPLVTCFGWVCSFFFRWFLGCSPGSWKHFANVFLELLMWCVLTFCLGLAYSLLCL